MQNFPVNPEDPQFGHKPKPPNRAIIRKPKLKVNADPGYST